jgi:Endoplasmic Reticulum Oxidoreductin 1 (ERO1)
MGKESNCVESQKYLDGRLINLLQSANLDCFVSRIGSHPERLHNVYFTHTLLMRALVKLSDYLNEYTFCTGDVKEEAETKVQSS